MTTKFFDNKICSFEILLSWRFPQKQKQRFGRLSCPPRNPPPQNAKILFLGNENSAQSFSDRSFWKSLRLMDVRAFGSWMSAPRCFFFRDFERPDRSFGQGYPREWPPDVRGISIPKTSSLGCFFVLEVYCRLAVSEWASQLQLPSLEILRHHPGDIALPGLGAEA